jgi:hypothetical protein
MDEPLPSNDHVILQILDSWPRLLRLLLIMAAIFAIVWLSVISILRALPAETSEVQLGIGDSRILLKQTTKSGESSLLVVSPQGWNRTAIQIKEGETFKIQAAGKVHIDLTDLDKAMEARWKAEDRIRRAGGPPPGKAPEDLYAPEEIAAMTDTWAWSSPEGVPKEDMARRSLKARRERSILPGLPYGVLIGAFNDRNEDPDADNDLVRQLATSAFRVGSYLEQKSTAKSTGYLYLTVNDVQYGPGPQLFFMDNIGAFYVKVEVQH